MLYIKQRVRIPSYGHIDRRTDGRTDTGRDFYEADSHKKEVVFANNIPCSGNETCRKTFFNSFQPQITEAEAAYLY